MNERETVRRLALFVETMKAKGFNEPMCRATIEDVDLLLLEIRWTVDGKRLSFFLESGAPDFTDLFYMADDWLAEYGLKGE